jgi:S1-C subfamily serine protease
MRSGIAATLASLVLAASAASAHPQPGEAGPEVHRAPGPGWHHPMFDQFVPNPGRLGVQLQDMTPELREFLHAPKERGVLVVRVNEGSAAEKAGLRVGDVIVSVGGEAVTETFEVVHAVVRAEKDTKLALEVTREGKSRTLEATIAGEPPMAAAPMRFFEERVPEMRESLELRMRELEERMRELEQRLKDAAPESDELAT